MYLKNKNDCNELQARGGAAAADANARKLLHELDEIYRWLDPSPLADLDSLPQVTSFIVVVAIPKCTFFKTTSS